MEKLISKLFEMIDKNDYKNIINISTWLFMLVVPSYLWFFIYRIDLFKTLDTLKLLILCIGINSFCIFILFITIYIIKECRSDNYKNDKLDEDILKYSTIRLKSIAIVIIVLIFILQFIKK
ncbi:hypothetical protein [Romboutsia ilealis]|uniref:hypothetical protein n=1 Tax=Romboutsia ilealis TaxID=1115758 RepID=UPI0023F5459D|nr:hypothetical protein [Romboutsia ilealis]